jgi:6-phospho-beta-glucosidase
MKDVERATIEAATSGSRAAALKALALHPLVDSVTHARAILETELAALPELARVLTRP